MRLVRFQHYRRRSIGAQMPDGRIVDLPAAAAAWLVAERQDPLWEAEVELRLPPDVGRFLTGGKPSLALATAAVEFAQLGAQTGIGGEPLFVNEAEIRLLPPLSPRLILASGACFAPDAMAQTDDVWRHREFFMRDPFNILGPGDAIQLPTWLGDDFDLSARLAVVIGRPVRGASAEQAAEAIFGYCPVIEVCARAHQKISWAGALFHVRYPHARAFDGSLLLGPSVISKDELDWSAARTTRLLVDGVEVGQCIPTPTIEDVADWICHLSETVTLEPGTLFILGSADDTAVRPTEYGELPVELANRTASKNDRLRPGARVALTLDKFTAMETTIQRIGEEEAALCAKSGFEAICGIGARSLGDNKLGMEATVVDKLGGSKCVLVVVDMQNDYCHVDGTYSRNGLICFDMESVLRSSITAVETCKSRKIPVIYVRMVWNSDAQGHPIDAGLIVESRSFLRKQGLRRGTWGAEMVAGMPPPDYVVEKTRYSGFHNTSLEPLLRGLGADTILLAGVITNVCVEATARDAFHRDFRIIVLSDCVSGFNRKLHDASLETLRIFGRVTTAAGLFGEEAETKTPVASIV